MKLFKSNKKRNTYVVTKHELGTNDVFTIATFYNEDEAKSYCDTMNEINKGFDDYLYIKY